MGEVIKCEQKNRGGANGMLPLVAMKEQEENDVRYGRVLLVVAVVGGVSQSARSQWAHAMLPGVWIVKEQVTPAASWFPVDARVCKSMQIHCQLLLSGQLLESCVCAHELSRLNLHYEVCVCARVSFLQSSRAYVSWPYVSCETRKADVLNMPLLLGD